MKLEITLKDNFLRIENVSKYEIGNNIFAIFKENPRGGSMICVKIIPMERVLEININHESK
jgi:hypothetical protein